MSSIIPVKEKRTFALQRNLLRNDLPVTKELITCKDNSQIFHNYRPRKFVIQKEIGATGEIVSQHEAAADKEFKVRGQDTPVKPYRLKDSTSTPSRSGSNQEG